MSVNRINDEENTIYDLILEDKIDLIINIPSRNNTARDGFLIRRFAVESGIPTFTSLDTAQALITSLEKQHVNKLNLIDITKLN